MFWGYVYFALTLAASAFVRDRAAAHYIGALWVWYLLATLGYQYGAVEYADTVISAVIWSAGVAWFCPRGWPKWVLLAMGAFMAAWVHDDPYTYKAFKNAAYALTTIAVGYRAHHGR